MKENEENKNNETNNFRNAPVPTPPKSKVPLKYVAFAAILAALVGTVAVVLPPSLPKTFVEIDKFPAIYPDYSETTLPPNIAPTNFRVEEPAERYATKISSENGSEIIVSGQDVEIPPKKWRRLLEANREKTLYFDVFVRNDGKWSKFRTIENKISGDPIDPYVAYRLIEPCYIYGNRIALAERSLETFRERIFFNNRPRPLSCCNCHSFQDRRTNRFLFHFRSMENPKTGGTIVVDGKSARKVDGKWGEVGASCSYPAWRPTGDLVAFSSNQTRQVFHSESTQKIEVYDFFSDLVLYDVVKNELTPITRTDDEYETFPNWSPDGKALYYCCARVSLDKPLPEGKKWETVASQHIKDFRYNINKINFDEKTQSFGPSETVVDAASQGRTALFPRVSPDGKFLIYTLAESGTFPIWRPEADLYLLDLTTGITRPLTSANGENSDSYHTWDSSGRWLIFSSRREDGQYTRLYFTHIDENGRETKPFVLPQRNPRANLRRFKSYNVPELMVEPIRINLKKLYSAAAKDPIKTEIKENNNK